MNLPAISHRFRWLHLPTGMLIMLLQRAPAPAVRVLVQLESLVSNQGAVILRSSIVAAAMGAYHSVAGATVFNVTPTAPFTVTPASGPANSTFTVTGTTGMALNLGISVSGAPGNPKSWSVKATTPLPAGLGVTGGNPVNVTAPYKMYIAGTPTAAGNTSVTITAWDGSNGTGGNSARITVTFNLTGGVSNVAPAITAQPSGLTVTAGSPAAFTVSASGTPTPTLQWQKDGVNVPGATSATLSLTNVQITDAGSYTAVATNVAGSATSSGATLTVNPAPVAPVFTTQPSAQTVTAGGTVSFTVAASGYPAPAFQWMKNGVNIPGATGATLALTNVQSADAGSYNAVAANAAGSTSSSIATLTVNPAPVAPAFTTQPLSQTITAGTPATFTVAASGSPAPTYQWQKDGVNLAGATSATLTLASVQNSDAGSYTAIATNSAGSANSAGATLTVQHAPAIMAHPASQAVTVGSSVTFTVAAVGTPALNFQWYKNGAVIAGATTASYSLASVQPSDAGTYAAVVSNVAGTATSNTAALTVNLLAQSISFTPPADQPFAPAPIALSATASSGLPVNFAIVSGPAMLNGSNVVLTGAGTITVRALQPGNATYNPAASVDGSFVVSANFASWLQSKFTAGELADPARTGPNAVYGLDGLSNLFKYALGLEPKQDITTGLPEVSAIGTNWAYTFARPSNVTDVTWEVEVSLDGVNWTTAGVTLTQVSTVGGFATWRALYPIGPPGDGWISEMIYFRLKVTRP